MLSNLSQETHQYILVTGNYWAFTLTDGALRMLVVLHFHTLGYSPLQIALLFLFYEIFGVMTNLVGGWLGAHIGLNKTMNIGLGLQVIALSMLLVPASMLVIPWVMAAQAVSGIAKDLNKMSAKSAIKLLVPNDAQGTLYQWVAILTGSKNALKGAGFFLGAALLTLLEFSGAIAVMMLGLMIVWMFSLLMLKKDLGKAQNKPKFTDILSKSRAINYLSAARMFLFAARDIWFVVALPVYLATTLKWDHWTVGGFLALWVIGYGVTQSIAPYFTGKHSGKLPDGRMVFLWAIAASSITALIALTLTFEFWAELSLLIGLILFGVLFAINSSMHSYLIVSFASEQDVSLDVGFYYMANAMGRLIGTVLSGWLFQVAGLQACLWVATVFILTAAMLSRLLPTHKTLGDSSA
jgi:MFS transporter, APGE family, 1-arseno-3-phosphoglycerate exporter